MLCKGYLSGLSSHLFNIYAKKLKDFDIVDPYEIPFTECEENTDEWPEVEHGDIVNYLVFSTHTFTNKQMKAYKSLEAHNYYSSGWVNNRVYLKVLPKDRILMLGQVKHSQSIRASPLKVWLLCKKDGEVLTGHCNCMAGMGEACSHIGAFLFLIEAGTRLKKDTSCTDKKNAWMQPYMRDVEFSQIKDINFESASTKFKKTVLTLNNSKRLKFMPSVPEPSTEELSEFFGSLENAGLSSAILSVVEPFNSKFIKEDEIIQKLTNLYCIENMKLSWQELINKCREVANKLVVTKCDAADIERATKRQSSCKKWFDYRTGRITASNMKTVCRGNIDCPAISTIKSICYPSLHKFSTCATEWGKQHERVAKYQYISQIEKNHSNFMLVESGLHINPNYPYIGATPDGLTVCDCCGNGIIEIKCPYIHRDSNISELAKKNPSFLIIDEAGNLSLDKNHEFFYQVQTQLLVTNYNHCDFVVWTSKDIYVERIFPDEVLHETISEKAMVFFTFCILPELLAKWYTNKE